MEKAIVRTISEVWDELYKAVQVRPFVRVRRGRLEKVRGYTREGVAAAETEVSGEVRIGFRDNWDKQKYVLMARWMPRSQIVKSVEEKRKIILEQLEVLDSMSKDELEYFVIFKTLNVFNNDVPDSWIEKLRGGKDEDVEEVFRLSKEQGIELTKTRSWGSWSMDGSWMSRLDEDSARRVADVLINEYKSRKRDSYDENMKSGAISVKDGLYALAEFGPTDKFRRELVDRLVKEKIFDDKTKFDAVPEVSTEENIRKLILKWTLAAGTVGSMWLQASVVKVFDGADGIEGYWHPNALGIRMNDPPPEYLDAVREIYRRTQEFYAKKKVKELKVYRGVKGEVEVRSPIESWTTRRDVAKKFGGKDVLEDVVPVSRIFMSWESMKGIWPKEEDLEGKREVTVLGWGLEKE